MPNRDHARRLMLILLASDADKQSFRLAQDGPAPVDGRERDEHDRREAGADEAGLPRLAAGACRTGGDVRAGGCGGLGVVV